MAGFDRGVHLDYSRLNSEHHQCMGRMVARLALLMEPLTAWLPLGCSYQNHPMLDYLFLGYNYLMGCNSPNHPR